MEDWFLLMIEATHVNKWVRDEGVPFSFVFGSFYSWKCRVHVDSGIGFYVHESRMPEWVHLVDLVKGRRVQRQRLTRMETELNLRIPCILSETRFQPSNNSFDLSELRDFVSSQIRHGFMDWWESVHKMGKYEHQSHMPFVLNLTVFRSKSLLSHQWQRTTSYAVSILGDRWSEWAKFHILVKLET